MFLRLAAVALVAGAAASPAAAAPPGPDACAAGHETLLRDALPMAAPFGEARAVWLDAHRLRWAGIDADGRFALVFSRDGRLRLHQGQVVQGADAVLELDVSAEPAPSEAGKRFSHVGAGVVLALRAADRGKLRQLLRGQSMLVQRDARGRVSKASAVQVAGALDALYASAEAVPDLGAAVRDGRSTFKLWAPTAQSVAVCIDAGIAVAKPRVLPMQRNERNGVWHASAAADLTGRHYIYLVDVFVPGHGLVRNLVTDPYSLSVSADSERSMVLDLDAPALKPPGWDATPRPDRVASSTDMVVYELHVRDFSIGDASVPEAHRGKYLGFTDTGSLGMQHLQRLSSAGVTDVHLLPVFDLATVPERGCTTPPASTLSAGAPDSEGLIKSAPLAGLPTGRVAV